MDTSYADIDSLLGQFARKALSPREVLQAHLQRIERHNPAINAFTVLDAERAMEAAEQSEARWMRGQPAGPLDGIVFTAKDNLKVRGLPCRNGSLSCDDTPSDETSPCVQRCQEAGAVLVGLTTMPEYGVGSVTTSPLSGVTANPWNPGMHVGGSTGGGAAAASAGFATFSVGSDAGGSLRTPAALSGLVGFKPTRGLVPIYPTNIAGTLSSFGPLARSVRDAAKVLEVISRKDAREPTALVPRVMADELSTAEGVLKGRRIALSRTLGYAELVDPETLRALDGVAAALRSLGAIVEEVDPGIANPAAVQRTLIMGFYRQRLNQLGPQARDRLSPVLKELLQASEAVTLEDFLRAQAQAEALGRHMAGFHQRHELLVTPTVAWPAFPKDRACPAEFEALGNPRGWTCFPALFNVTQQPALSLPMGFNAQGLPLGAQIVAAQGEDKAVLEAALALEKALALDLRPPL